MRENKEERAENGSARRKLERAAGDENSHGIDDIAILDYVMRDFGSPEEPRHGSGIRRRTSGVLDLGEDLA